MKTRPLRSTCAALRCRRARSVAILTTSMALCAAQAEAANGTWQAVPTNSNWVAVGGEDNWTTVEPIIPGSTSGLANGDTATFLTSGTTGITINSPTLNVRSINFGSATVFPSGFTIGNTAGNSLFLSNAGTIQIVAGSTGTNLTEMIDAPLVLAPATVTTAGSYTFTNSHATSSNILVFNGAISGGTTTAGVTLNLSGSNTGANAINGVISDGGAAGGVSIFAFGGVSNWGLTAANTFTGATGITNSTTLNLRGVNGSALSTSAVNLTGGTLRLDNTTASGGPNGNRLADGVAINSNGGNAGSGLTFAHSAAAATNYAETVGALNLNAGHFTFAQNAAAAGQSSIFTFSGGLNRVGTYATVGFQSGNADNIRQNVFLTGLADSTFLGGWATVTGGGFAQYTSTRGIFAVTNTSANTLAAASSSATTSYSISSATAQFATAGGIYLGRSLAMANSGAVSPVLDLNGSTFKLTSGGITNNADIGTSTISNGTITVGDGNSSPLYIILSSSSGLTVNAVLADNGGPLVLVKSGAGSALTLTAANTFTGSTIVNSGSINVTNELALQNSVIDNYTAAGGTVTWSNVVGFSPKIGGLTGTKSLPINTNLNNTVTLGNSTGGPGVDASFSGILGLNGLFRLVKVGANKQTLTGTNNFTGGVTINGGILAIGGGEVLNPTGVTGAAGPLGKTGNITFGGGTLQYSATNSFDYSGRIAPGISTGAVAIDTNGVDVTFASVLTGDQTGGLTKSGAGILTLAAANGYLGTTTVSGGTLKAGSLDAFGSVNNGLTVNTGGTVDLAGTNQAAGRLDGTGGSITSSLAGAMTLTLGSNNATGGSYAGALTNGAGTLAVSKTGTGTQTLTGTSTFTGGTAITDGRLSISTDAALGAASAPVTIGGGAVLQAIGNVTTAARTVTLDTGGGAIDVTTGNVASFNAGSTITGAATLTKTGAGTLTLAGTQTYSSLTTGGGTTNINSALGTGAATVTANATTNFGASQTLAALNIGAGAVVTLTATPPFAPFAGGGSAVVPEPGSIALLLVGVLGLASRRRRSVLLLKSFSQVS